MEKVFFSDLSEKSSFAAFSIRLWEKPQTRSGKLREILFEHRHFILELLFSDIDQDCIRHKKKKKNSRYKKINK